MKIVCLLLLVVFVTNQSSACDCNYQGPFLKMARHSSLVAFVKIRNHISQAAMEVEILDVFHGSESRKVITVWGDDGKLCRPYTSQFQKDTFYVIAFYAGEPGGHPDEKESDYHISNCGAYWLSANMKDSTVSGDISSSTRTIQTLLLSELKSFFVKKNG